MVSMKVKVAQSFLTLCIPMDYIVHGILHARILEWVAFHFSKGSSQPRDQTQVSCITGGFFTSWATSSVQLSRVWLFANPWTAACRDSLSFNSQSLLKLKSIESVMPSNHLILFHPLLLLPSIFPSIRVFFCLFVCLFVFPVSQFFSSGGWSIGASVSVLRNNM